MGTFDFMVMVTGFYVLWNKLDIIEEFIRPVAREHAATEEKRDPVK